jgi:hypothetical protein
VLLPLHKRGARQPGAQSSSERSHNQKSRAGQSGVRCQATGSGHGEERSPASNQGRLPR